jgi:hypothetical protein
MFHQLFGTLVWLAANGLYIDLRRKGRQGLARILFFWMGMPATWLWLFLIPEGNRQEKLRPPEDDYRRLLQEIRRDRALTEGEAGTGPPDAPERSGSREDPPPPSAREPGGEG